MIKATSASSCGNGENEGWPWGQSCSLEAQMMGKEEASGLRGKEAPSGNRWAPLSGVKDLALQPFFPSLGKLWDGKQDGS